MHFASLEYAVLLAVVFALFWAVARAPRVRMLVLLAASYLFYARWNSYYLLLIVGSSALDFVAGNKLHEATRPAARRGWLLVSVAGNLGLLALFKYYDFFVENVAAALGALGWSVSLPQLQLLLPVGISFYTFQSMSYTIDVYRGELEPASGPLSFFTFVALFPQLVAGPIVRARELLPQLEAAPRLRAGQGGRALFLISVGLLKKAVIADLLAINLVDRVFETPQLYTSAELLLGVYGYAIQIYCDFSAYTDIAIGSALLLGLQLPPNFDRPYLAVGLRDFWRRWHISLSTWLRDYLYIPLGGSRGSPLRTYRNLALTMLLGGLWHGAAWNFVIWGALHGTALALERMLRGRLPPVVVARRLARAMAGLLTLHFVCLAWIFFRAPDLALASQLLDGLAALTPGTANITPMLWGLLAAGAATHIAPAWLVERAEGLMVRAPALVQAALLAAAVLATRQAMATDVVRFIYFQF